MMIYVAQGHDVASLEPLAIPLRVERQPRYTLEYAADGVARAVGGANAVLIAEALDFDEAVSVLEQLGLSMFTPSTEVTITLEDDRRLPIPFYGVVTLDTGQIEGAWWKQFRLELTGLVAVI